MRLGWGDGTSLVEEKLGAAARSNTPSPTMTTPPGQVQVSFAGSFKTTLLT